MSKYLIVSKDRPGNQAGRIYEVEYQVDGYGTTRFKVDLFCRGVIDGKMAYCYLADRPAEHINDNADRDEFLQEFYKFQKGGSYRISNPVLKSEVELLKETIKSKRDELYDLEKNLRDAEYKAKQDKFSHYYDDVDRESLDKFVSSLVNAMTLDTRYKVSSTDFHIWDGYRIFVEDTLLHKIIKIVQVTSNGSVISRDLDVDDMKI